MEMSLASASAGSPEADAQWRAADRAALIELCPLWRRADLHTILVTFWLSDE
jgi:hypothetical protein